MHKWFLWALMIVSFGCANEQPAIEQPNIVLIIGDDISWNDLGYYGKPVIWTPHIDKLAKEGLRFNNMFLTSSSCSPSRTSIITGRYSHNTGAAELHTCLPNTTGTTSKLTSAWYVPKII